MLRLLATAERPMDHARLGVAAAGLEEQLAGHLPPRSATGPRRGSDHLDADLAAGLDEALEYGFVRLGEDGLLRIRHELVARAVVADLLPAQVPRYRLRSPRRSRTSRSSPRTSGGPLIDSTRPGPPPSMPVAWRCASRRPRTRSWRSSSASSCPRRPRISGEDNGAELLALAAEAAYASMRPTRAVAYAESARAVLGERKDRMAWAVVEARLGRYKLAAGDSAGATAALRRAAETVPPDASVERARILALLAQERMIAGAFADAERAADRAAGARAVARRRRGARGDPRAYHSGRRARLG